MPRVAKTPRTRLHNKAVAVAAREDAASDDGMLVDELTGADSEVEKEDGPSDVPHRPSKADKKVRQVVQSKLPEFRHHYLESGQPYSKSHMKRMKRKAKEQLAGGGLSSLVAHLDDNVEDAEETSKTSRRPRQPKSTANPSEKGKIGEGRGRTLREGQRRKQITTNRTHIQAVLQNPSFKANPFAAIRLHATNSLVLQDSK